MRAVQDKRPDYTREYAVERGGRRPCAARGGRRLCAGLRIPRRLLPRTLPAVSERGVRRALHLRAIEVFAPTGRRLVRRLACMGARLSDCRAEPDEDHERGELPLAAHG